MGAIGEISGKQIDARAFYRALGLFFVLLVAFGLSWGAAVGTLVDTPVRADAADYVRYAWNLKYHGTYSDAAEPLYSDAVPVADARRVPGYPLFLVPFMERQPTRQFERNVQIAQAVVFTLTVLCIFLLARTFLSYAPSLGAAALTAVSPHLVNSVVYLLTETLFTFFVVFSLLVVAWLIRRPKISLSLLGGVVLAMGALVRPSLLYFPLLLIPFLWISIKPATRVRVVVAFAAAFLAVTCTWGARNLSATGVWSDDTPLIQTILHGSYPDMMYEGDPDTLGVAYASDPNEEAATENLASVVREVFGDISREPGKYAYWYLIGKPLMFWQWDTIAGMGEFVIYPLFRTPYNDLYLFSSSRDLMQLLHWPLVVLAGLGCVIGLVRSRQRDREGKGRPACAGLVALLLVYFTALHMVAAPYPRYSIPLRPEMYAMALYMVVLLIGQFQSLFGGRSGRDSGSLGN